MSTEINERDAKFMLLLGEIKHMSDNGMTAIEIAKALGLAESQAHAIKKIIDDADATW